MIAVDDTSAEDAILSLFCDDDGDVDVAAALEAMTSTIAGLAALATHCAPHEFAEVVAQHIQEKLRLGLGSTMQ